VHKTSSFRRSWAPHGVDGWYIGAAPHHYRCWQVFIPQTAGKRYSDTVKFFPATVPMPQLSSADAATQAIRDLLQALKNPHLATPFALLGDAQHSAIKQLALIFADAVPNQSDPNGTVGNASESATSVRDKSRTHTNTSEHATSAPHLRSAKPTELNRLEGTAASSKGVPTSSEGGSTRYQRRCQSLYGRPASTTRPHASLSNSLATPPEPSLTSSQPCRHHHRTHLPATTRQPEPTRRQLSPRSNHWPVPQIPPTLSGPHQRQMDPWVCQQNRLPGPRCRHLCAHRYGHNSLHPT
jgi:hypothetical protein